MHISPINYYQPHFQANRRTVLDSNGKLLYKTTTYFFRDDFDWTGFANLLKQKYRNTIKVNFIIHACSNGLEVYSCIMKLITELGKEAEKFFPIIAKDINDDNIRAAKNNCSMGITDYDQARINYHTRNRLYKYMEFTKTSSPEEDAALIPKPIIRKKAIFAQGDILDDLDNIQKENTIILCRNFWLYLDKDTREMLADKLATLETGSLVGIGYFDMNVSADKLLMERGFVETDVKHVFAKPSRQDFRQL